jgi:hypothetical protein
MPPPDWGDRDPLEGDEDVPLPDEAALEGDEDVPLPDR